MLLDAKSRIKKHFGSETVISDLFDDNLTEIDFIKSLSELELIYGFEIPEEFYDRIDITLGELANELSELPVISEELYPEFFDIKMECMKLTKRYIELETNAYAESVCEMDAINQQFELLTDRLNVLLENTLVN